MKLNPLRKDSTAYVISVGVGGLIVAFLIALILGGCDDGEGRHAPKTCKTVAQASCLTEAGKYGYGVRCALLASDGSRYNASFTYPIMAGDRMCLGWVTP